MKMLRINEMEKKAALLVGGNALICLGVALYRLAALGTDPYSAMNLGFSSLTGFSFGNCQLAVNAVLMVVMISGARQLIGVGTFVNAIGVGYGADAIYWLLQNLLGTNLDLASRAVLLAAAIPCSAMGVGMYMNVGLGISPYDSIGVIIESKTHGKIPFSLGRMMADLTSLSAGIALFLCSGEPVWKAAGIGTVCNALLLGPMIHFFQKALFEDHRALWRRLRRWSRLNQLMMRRALVRLVPAWK